MIRCQFRVNSFTNGRLNSEFHWKLDFHEFYGILNSTDFVENATQNQFIYTKLLKNIFPQIPWKTKQDSTVV